MIQPYLNQKITCWFRWLTLVICLNFGIPMGPQWDPNGLMSIPGIDRGLTTRRFSRLHAGRFSVLAERFRGRRKLRGKTHGKTHGKSPLNDLLILLVDDIWSCSHNSRNSTSHFGSFYTSDSGHTFDFLKLGHWGDLLKSENMFASIAHSLEHGNSAISCDSKVPQCGAPKIAKLVITPITMVYGTYNYSQRGL